MKKADKEWARAKIFQIIDTPTKDLLMDDPRDKLVQKNVQKNPYGGAASHTGKATIRREKYSPETEQMQLFAKYLAEELKKRGFDQK